MDSDADFDKVCNSHGCVPAGARDGFSEVDESGENPLKRRKNFSCKTFGGKELPGSAFGSAYSACSGSHDKLFDLKRSRRGKPPFGAPGRLLVSEGEITPSETGEYRFVGMGDDVLIVGLDRKTVFYAYCSDERDEKNPEVPYSIFKFGVINPEIPGMLFIEKRYKADGPNFKIRSKPASGKRRFL